MWGERPTKPRIRVLAVRDRDNPDSAPLVYVLIEQEEIYITDDHGRLLKAEINIYYHAVSSNNCNSVTQQASPLVAP